MERAVLAGRTVQRWPHGAGVRSSAPGDPHDLDPERSWLHALRRLLARQDGRLPAADDGWLDRERLGAVATMWPLASLLARTGAAQLEDR
jgi:hypothetical protein